MSDLQYLPLGNISSNSRFFYKDTTSNEYDNRIKFTHQFEKKLQVRHDANPRLKSHLAYKKIDPDLLSAFDKAVIETSKTDDHVKTKNEVRDRKRKVIEGIVKERDKMIKERLQDEKNELEVVLVRIIKDALKFSKESTPMISMMPNKLTNAINHLKERGGSNPNLLNISSGSLLNLSMKSNTSNRSIQKYESNRFLKALGLDLQNLNKDNIKVDIDQAYDFIKMWKVKKEDINQVIRFKVVNEIMNVEERRSVQKLEKLNKKYSDYVRRKTISVPKQQPVIEEAKNAKTVNSVKTVKTGPKRMASTAKQKKEVFAKQTSNVVEKNPVRQEVKRTADTNTGQSPSRSRSRSGFRSRSKRYQEEPVQRKKIKLNSYKNVDKIIRIIHGSDELSNNENLSKHFYNIKCQKRYDDLTKKAIRNNKLGLEPEPEIEEKTI